MQPEVFAAVDTAIHHFACTSVSPALTMINSLRTWTAALLKLVHRLLCHAASSALTLGKHFEVNADSLTAGDVYSFAIEREGVSSLETSIHHWFSDCDGDETFIQRRLRSRFFHQRLRHPALART